MPTLLVCAILIGHCAATSEHEIVRYKGRRRLQGKATDFSGAPIPAVDVEIYDRPEVWSDDGLNLNQKRLKQHKVASVVTDEKGRFNLGGVPAGYFEVQFSRPGWNTLSVLLNVDPRLNQPGLCVELRISGNGGEGKVKDCH
jgi:hypothetical protein